MYKIAIVLGLTSLIYYFTMNRVGEAIVKDFEQMSCPNLSEAIP